MPKDYEGSLGHQHTLQGGKPAESSPQSLGDQSTFGGGDSSSMADLTGLGADDGVDMEVVDLSARYKVERVLGKGGMGEVLMATDTRLERKVAIKRIRGDATGSRTAVNRFLTEAKAIAALSHANAVQIYDYGRDKDGPFLIMEYVDGGSLLDRCRKGVLPVEEAVDLACQLCDGLARAHDAGIIHRDIKPANVLLTKDGIPKLTDFGLAKAESNGHGQTVAGAVLGTIDFMPPEQRRDAALADARSDLWSLAATLYQMVTGEPPSVVDLEVVPQQLRATLGRALKAKKEERFQSARELKAALRGSLQAPVSEIAAEVAAAGEGVCLNCATRNEPHRKFCKECAASLRAGCLSCRIPIPVWDKVCPECGAQQLPLVQERIASLEKTQSDAESKLETCDFDAARELAEPVERDADPRFLQHAAWAKQFLDQLKTRQAEQLARASDLMCEAIRHEAAYDFACAITTLHQIPKPLLDATVPNQAESPSSMLRRVETKHEECRTLENSIRQAIASKQVHELLVKVDRFLELRPDRQDVQKLRLQLVDRQAKRIAMSNEAFAAAQEAMRVCDYDSVLRHLGRIDRSYLKAPMRSLAEDARSKRDRRNSLQKSIEERLSVKSYDGLLDQVRKLLELSPYNIAMTDLRDQLIAREQELREYQTNAIRQRDEAFTEAGRLLSSGNASAALQLVSKEWATRLTEPQAQLRDQLRTIMAAETELAKLYNFAKADGVIELREIACLLPRSEEYLELNPKHAGIRRLRDNLVAQILCYPKHVIAQLPPRIIASLPAPEILRLPPVTNSIGLLLKIIPPGTFMMGSGSLGSDEAPPHQVTLTRPFYLGVYAVTQEQYTSVTGRNPSYFNISSKCPVECVSWQDAVEFCQMLSALPEEQVAARVYRLPTEAQWEYACRAGTTTDYSFGHLANHLGRYAWYNGNSDETTHPAGQKEPNPWGIFDMHGNVWEWCQDWFKADYYQDSPTTDPLGPHTASCRVGRGGCWGLAPWDCRSTIRGGFKPSTRESYLGFRVALVPPGR